jgi:hypothetical protein
MSHRPQNKQIQKSLHCHLKMPRSQLTVGEKLKIVAQCKSRLNKGESLRSISRDFNLQPKQLRDWMKKFDALQFHKKTKKSISKGRPSILTPVEDELMTWFTNCRETGLGLSIDSLVLKAEEIVPSFRQLSKTAKYQVARRLLKANCVSIRRKTRVSQRRPDEVIEEASAFVKSMVPELQAPDVHQDYIINMDQTPVPFSLHGKTTLNFTGAKTVSIATSDKRCQRFTASLAITASGRKLRPMFTFKGVPTGRIALEELPLNPCRNRAALNCQDNAWFDTGVALKWIDRVLAPYVKTAPPTVRPILILDDYKVHKTAQFTAAIEALGVTVHYVPPGCTCLAQPIDVGIGKPFKDRLRDLWRAWMLEQGLDRTLWETPKRDLMSFWACQAWEGIPGDIVRNSWRKTDFSYFPEADEIEN